MANAAELPDQMPLRRVFETWWPLAFSWLLMSVELPAISAVIARLANPEINLAAYGGIVYPLALIIESPVIMLLSASTALSRHRQAYDRIWRFMMSISAVLTGLHILFAFTPLYYVVVRQVIQVPEEIVEPARIGLMIMIPWTWSIAFRRFQQGVMIRFGYSRAVGVGTIVRLFGMGLTLFFGFLIHSLPGVAVGAAAQIVGVMCEAGYAGWRVRGVINSELKVAPVDQDLSWRNFINFYIPLALNSLIFLIWQPIGSAALSRMPDALSSLAVWPVLSGLTFLLRSPGIAMNEVVVAALDRPGSSRSLLRFARRLALSTSLLHLLLAATPLALLYFTRVSALPANLAHIAQLGFWLALPLPALAVFQSWFQGKILFGKQTRGVPESVIVFLVTVLIVLGGGVIWGKSTGLFISMTGFALANIAQMGWLWYRSQPVTKFLVNRDGHVAKRKFSPPLA
jgi:hypothetical protein